MRRGGAKGSEPIRVEVKAVRSDLDRDMARIDQLSKLLDSQFSIAGVRFGWDALIGLVPVVGDITTGLLALYPIYLAGLHGLGGWTIGRMLGNVGLDLLVGAVPLLGDLFDVAFKANRRNLELFRTAAARSRR